MKTDNMEFIFKIISPFITLIISAIASFIGFLFGVAKSRRKDRREIYRQQLFNLYYPVYKILSDMQMNKSENKTIQNIHYFVEKIWPYIDTQTLLVPSSISFVFRRLQDSFSEGNDKKVERYFYELSGLLNDQYFLLKRKLGYPSIGQLKQLSFMPLIDQVLFWIFLSTIVFAFSLWEIMSISAKYSLKLIVISASFFTVSLLSIVIFAKRRS